MRQRQRKWIVAAFLNTTAVHKHPYQESGRSLSVGLRGGGIAEVSRVEDGAVVLLGHLLDAVHDGGGSGEGVGVVDAEPAASEGEDVTDESVVTLPVLHADTESSCDVISTVLLSFVMGFCL